MKDYLTDQESFWAGNFGDEYINRNIGQELMASNLNFFSRIFNKESRIESVIELGANVGMNLKAINLLYPKIKLQGVEINKKACNELSQLIGEQNAHHKSIFNFQSDMTFDLAFTKGVLIHINPKKLNDVYQKLYDLSRKYILIAEYYNPTPIKIKYRGHSDKLFKRDFAGDILDKFSDLKLLNYGFIYHRDNSFPQDDISWFLIEKK